MWNLGASVVMAVRCDSGGGSGSGRLVCVGAALEVFGHVNIALAAMLDEFAHYFRRRYAIGISFFPR